MPPLPPVPQLTAGPGKPVELTNLYLEPSEYVPCKLDLLPCTSEKNSVAVNKVPLAGFTNTFFVVDSVQAFTSAVDPDLNFKPVI